MEAPGRCGVNPKKRYLDVIELSKPAGADPVHRVEVTGKSEGMVEKTLRGMLRNMDTDRFYVRDSLVMQPVGEQEVKPAKPVPKFAVGSPVVILYRYATKMDDRTSRGVVEKVGRKYFTVQGWPQSKFDRETGLEAGDYQHYTACTPEEHAQSVAVDAATEELRNMGITFSHTYVKDAPNVRKIAPQILAAVKSILALGVLAMLVACGPARPAFRACPDDPSKIDYIMHADTSFTAEERAEIEDAAAQWSEASCTAHILVRYDRPNAANVWQAEADAGRRTLVRGTSTAPPSADGKRHDGGTSHDRMVVWLNPHKRFARLALHEFGHMILNTDDHGPEGTVMVQDQSEGSDWITDEDFAWCQRVGACAP